MNKELAALLVRVGMAIEAEFGGDFDCAPRIWFPSRKCEKYIIPICDMPARWVEHHTPIPLPAKPPSFGQEAIELQEVGNDLHAYAGFGPRSNTLIVWFSDSDAFEGRRYEE